MLKIPADEASGNEIDLGILYTEAGLDEARSANKDEENATLFNFTLDQLKKIARTDNMLKFIKNVYINCNESTGAFYTSIPAFTFRDSLSMIENQWANPVDIVNNPYFTPLVSIAFQTIASSFTNTYSSSITITPPGTVRIEDYNDSSIYTEYNAGEEIPTNEHSAPNLAEGIFGITFSYYWDSLER